MNSPTWFSHSWNCSQLSWAIMVKFRFFLKPWGKTIKCGAWANIAWLRDTLGPSILLIFQRKRMGFLAVDHVRTPPKIPNNIEQQVTGYRTCHGFSVVISSWEHSMLWQEICVSFWAFRFACLQKSMQWKVVPNLPTYLAVPHLQQLRDSIHFPNFSPSAPTKKSSITFFHPIITSCFPTEDSLPKRLLSHGELVRRKCCWWKWWTCVVFPQVHGKVANIKSQHRLTKHWELHQETWKNKNYLGPLPPTKNAPRKIVFQFHQVLVRFVPDIHSSKLFLGSPPVSLGGNVGSCSRRKSSSNFTWHLRRSFVFRNHDSPMESQRVCWDYTPWN